VRENGNQNNIDGSLKIGEDGKPMCLFKKVPVNSGQTINGEKKIVYISGLKRVNGIVTLKKNKGPDQKGREHHPAPDKPLYSSCVFFF
jgi:hypothetical protein